MPKHQLLAVVLGLGVESDADALPVGFLLAEFFGDGVENRILSSQHVSLLWKSELHRVIAVADVPIPQYHTSIPCEDVDNQLSPFLVNGKVYNLATFMLCDSLSDTKFPMNCPFGKAVYLAPHVVVGHICCTDQLRHVTRLQWERTETHQTDENERPEHPLRPLRTAVRAHVPSTQSESFAPVRRSNARTARCHLRGNTSPQDAP